VLTDSPRRSTRYCVRATRVLRTATIVLRVRILVQSL
jgi:hypothetical protein